MKDRLSNAISRAKKLNDTHQKKRTELISRDSNPSTQVFKLVEFIQQLIEKNKKN